MTIKKSSLPFLEALIGFACLLLSTVFGYAGEGGVTLEAKGFQVVLPSGWEVLNQPTNFFVQQRARNAERNISVGVGSHQTGLPLDQYATIAVVGFQTGLEPQYEALSKRMGLPVSEIEKLLRSQIGGQLLQRIKDAYRTMSFELLDVKKIEIAGTRAYELRTKTIIRESGGVLFTRQFSLAGFYPAEVVEITFAGPEAIFQDQGLVDAIRMVPGSVAANPAVAEKALDYFNGGMSKAEQGDRAGAVVDFDKAIELRPDYAEAYNKRGMVKVALAPGPDSDLSSVLSDYNYAIALKPDYADAYYNRALLRQVKSDRKGAIADYSKVIGLYPSYAKAYHNRGMERAAGNDFAGGLADLDKAIELEPGNYSHYEARARVKSVKGDQAGAQADNQTASALKARNSRSHEAKNGNSAQ